MFGLSLNKKPKKEGKGDAGVGKGEGERKSVWKLRRWSKSRGYHTVVVNGEGEKDHGQGCEKTDNTEIAETGRTAKEESNKVHVCMYR